MTYAIFPSVLIGCVLGLATLPAMAVDDSTEIDGA